MGQGGSKAKPATKSPVPPQSPTTPTAKEQQQMPSHAPGSAHVAGADIRAEFSYLSLPDTPELVQTPPTHCERVRAAFLLSAIGDAIGFGNSQWEHCSDYSKPLFDMARRGGLLVADLSSFRVSDETVMALATARVLSQSIQQWDQLMNAFAQEWHLAFSDCSNRSLDQCTSSAYRTICKFKGVYEPFALEFNLGHTSCGAAVRSWPIGIYFAGEDQLVHLMTASMESARITHHHPIGFVSALTSSLFVSLALRGVPTSDWGVIFLEMMPQIRTWIRNNNRDPAKNEEGLNLVEATWRMYLDHRRLSQKGQTPFFPSPNDVTACHAAYSQLASWGLSISQSAPPLAGSEGHHCVIIAYDAILTAEYHNLGGTRKGWVLVLERAAMHGGDSDGTGALAGALWGAKWGIRGVPPCHRDKIEMRAQLITTADQLQTAMQWPLDAPLMPEPLRRGSALLAELNVFMHERSDAAAYKAMAKAHNEEITKLSIQMDGMEGLIECEREERRRLLRGFDQIESELRSIFSS